MKPTILDHHGRPARLSVSNRYEAARSSPNRSFIPNKLQSATRDINTYDRIVVASKSRFLYDNFPLYKALIDRMVVYIVGPGIFPVPSSSDEAFNKRTMSRWKRWARNPDLQTRISWGQSQRISLTRGLIDGDSFTYKTVGPSGKARVQLIEGPNISKNGNTIRDNDGYELDDFGRISKWFYRPDLEKGNDGAEIPIDPDHLVQHYFPHRAQQYRGIALAVSGINTAHDIDDTLALEKAAVKDGSSHTNIIKTATGAAVDAETLLRDGTEVTSETIGEFIEHYKNIFGPEAKVLRPGDEYTPYTSSRPSPAWQGFVDFLCEMVCLSGGIPPSILLQRKVGGSDTRRDAFAAQRVFEIYQYALADQYQRIYEYWLQSELDSGELTGAPDDWWEAEWYFPRTITVDSGRDMKSDIELVKMGLMTRREFFAIYSQTYWKSEMRQVAVEKREKYDLADEFKVPVWELELLTPNGNLTPDSAPSTAVP